MNRPDLARLLAPYAQELLAFRRDLHAHPELGHQEHRTTARVAQRLREAGLRPQLLAGTGLICDLGVDAGAPVVALRADLDALAVADDSGLDFASTVPGVCHACGHDVHTTVVLGAGLVLADLAAAGALAGGVRLIFQPAEEVHPSGALAALAQGALDGVGRAYALHCDPGTDVGRIAVRPGPITSASDEVLVRLHGAGGHTSRPHLTQDLVHALGQVVTQVPAVLSRRLDPRAGTAMVWGRISAGAVSNAIPRSGEVAGTLRCLDQAAWGQAGEIIAEIVHDVVRPYGVRAEVLHTRGVPPTVNDPRATLAVQDAALRELGEGTVAMAEQSLGGEDFAWMLEKTPGALFRLGTRTPGGRTYDLHQGDLIVDERAVDYGVRVLAAIALAALADPADPR